MGIGSLRTFLKRHRRLAIDTSIFIYQLEADTRYLAHTDEIFEWIEKPGHTAVTSAITMTELLVQPYRDKDESRADQFFGLLTTYPNLEWIPSDLEVADVAARIRAAHRLRTPDALQAASAIRTKATGLITNDAIFSRVPHFETLVLEQLL